MKISIDEISKIIVVKESMFFDELIDELNILLPNEAWKNYRIESTMHKDEIFEEETFLFYSN